jgi:hypothetical protein
MENNTKSLAMNTNPKPEEKVTVDLDYYLKLKESHKQFGHLEEYMEFILVTLLLKHPPVAALLFEEGINVSLAKREGSNLSVNIDVSRFQSVQASKKGQSSSSETGGDTKESGLGETSKLD